MEKHQKAVVEIITMSFVTLFLIKALNQGIINSQLAGILLLSFTIIILLSRDTNKGKHTSCSS